MKKLSRQCTKCKEFKCVSEFYKEPRTKIGLQSRCKICQQTAYNDYRKKNPDVYRKASLKHWHNLSDKKKHSKWIQRYGITADQYTNMFEFQNGKCKICNQECSTGRVLAVDHCHKTGKVRGLLCTKCNTALGMLNDNIKYFETAIEYLKSYEE